MHPELLSSLAVEHRRDLRSAMTAPSAYRVSGHRGSRPRDPAVTAATLPRYRVSWTRTSLAAVAGNRRARSVVIVISATRTL